MGKITHSIRTKVVIILLLMAVLMVGAVMILNSTMLERYYMADKKSSFIEAYNQVNRYSSLFAGEQLDENAYQKQLEQLSSQTNISILVIKSDWSTVFASMRNLDDFKHRLQNSLFLQVFEEMEDVEAEHATVEKNDRYTIRQVYNESMDDTFMELYGSLDNGNMVYMSIAIKSIQDNVQISNRFIWMIGVGLVLLSILVALGLGHYLTVPILNLTDVAKKMSELDFDVRYEGLDEGELGILGNSMNELSTKLESTISELKEANLKLMRDIESKEEAEERRKEFISNVSHELKTPIALIEGYAEGLKEGVNSDEQSREYYCDVIMDEARKMNGMVRDLLNLSHIESGSVTLDIERFELSEMIEGIINAKKLLAESKGCTIRYEKQYPCEVWADESRIEEVIVNYLVNAINHCEGKKEIVVRNERIDDEVKVSVYNSGVQIPEEEQEKIWIKFYKVDKARTREYGGNGIGLSIVKAILDLHGKKCGVENEKDGVTFWFTLDASMK